MSSTNRCDMLNKEISMLPRAVLQFRPSCPGCTRDTVSSPGARPCSHYDCPGLPEELQVTCNTCMYDFLADDGQVKCDHTTCETALRMQSNVPTYRTWLRLLKAETER